MDQGRRCLISPTRAGIRASTSISCPPCALFGPSPRSSRRRAVAGRSSISPLSPPSSLIPPSRPVALRGQVWPHLQSFMPTNMRRKAFASTTYCRALSTHCPRKKNSAAASRWAAMAVSRKSRELSAFWLRMRRAISRGRTCAWMAGLRGLCDLRLRGREDHAPYPSHQACAGLPDHLHAIWTMPWGDGDYATRWRLIKARFSMGLPRGVARASHQLRSERGVWQRRFWEHHLRNDEDYAAHMRFCRTDPVLHGLVETATEWPFSSFHQHTPLQKVG